MCTMVVTQLPTAPLLLLPEETGGGVRLREAGDRRLPVAVRTWRQPSILVRPLYGHWA